MVVSVDGYMLSYALYQNESVLPLVWRCQTLAYAGQNSEDFPSWRGNPDVIIIIIIIICSSMRDGLTLSKAISDARCLSRRTISLAWNQDYFIFKCDSLSSLCCRRLLLLLLLFSMYLRVVSAIASINLSFFAFISLNRASIFLGVGLSKFVWWPSH